MNPWTSARIIKWLEQALVGAAIVRKNIAIGWGEHQMREIK